MFNNVHFKGNLQVFFFPFVLLLDFLSGFETPSVLILSQPRYSAGLTVSWSLLVRSWVQHPRHGVKILVFWLLMWVVFLFELKERRIIWLAGRQRLLSFSFSLLQQPLPVQHLAGQEFNTVACLDSCKPQKLLSKQARGVFMCERDGTGRDGTGVHWSVAAPFLCGFLLSQATKCFLSLSITFFDLTLTGDEETWGFVCTSAHSLICFLFRSSARDSWWGAQRFFLTKELGPYRAQCEWDSSALRGDDVWLGKHGQSRWCTPH